MQARYYWHPVRHAVVSEYFASVRDRARANNMLLHLSDALVRSSKFDARKLSAVGMTDEMDFEVQRIRISQEKYPSLYRLYTTSPSRLRGYIFGEILAEAARFRQERPDEAGMLIMNLSASFEDVGEDAYPEIPSERAENANVEQSAVAKPLEEEPGEGGDDRVNGLGSDLLSSLNADFW